MNEKRVKTEIKKETKDFLELNKNKYTSYSNLWVGYNEIGKSVLRGKFLSLRSYIKNKMGRSGQ